MWPYYAAVFLLFMSPLLRAGVTCLSQMVQQPVFFFAQLEFKCTSNESTWPCRAWLWVIYTQVFFLCVMQDLLDSDNDVDIQANIGFQRCLSCLPSLSQLAVAYSTSVNDCNSFETVLSVYYKCKIRKYDFQSKSLKI